MTDPTGSPPPNSSGSFPARSLIRAIKASLSLVNDSVDSLNNSQMSAIQFKLRETLGILNQKIRENENLASDNQNDQNVVIDLSDWEDSDADDTSDERMDTGEEKDGTLPIPAPYPTTPLAGQETADAYYVVDCGREVGIFIDNILSTRAITGIPHGHQVKVKTWYDAATLYNSLWDKGLVTRVRL